MLGRDSSYMKQIAVKLLFVVDLLVHNQTLSMLDAMDGDNAGN